MTHQEPSFLLDIRVELSNAFKDTYEVTAKSENLFEHYLIHITKNNNKGHTKYKKIRAAQRQIKKKVPIRWPCGYEQYGISILLTKNATEIISNMKMHFLEIYIKSKTNSDAGIGTMFIPWTKSFITYLKTITEHPRLPPVTLKEKLNVVNSKNNTCLGSLNVTVKLMSLASNLYKFISCSKNNVRIYRNLFSNPKVLEKESSKFNEHRKHTEDRNDSSVLNSYNHRSDTTYNIIKGTKKKLPRLANNSYIKSTKDEKDICLENLAINPSFHKTSKILYELELTNKKKSNESDQHIDVSFKDRTYCINYLMLNVKNTKNLLPEKGFEEDFSEKSGSPRKLHSIKKKEDNAAIIALPVVNFKSKISSDANSDLSTVEVTSGHDIACDAKMRRSKLPVYDNLLALHLSTLHDHCCGKFEQKRSPNLKFDEHPCYCTCECKFEFIRDTTYCKICGGYEVIGEEFVDTKGQEMPMPCPIFHKLVEKNKLKSRSSSGSIRRRIGDGSLKSIRSSKSFKSTKSSTPKTSEKRLKVPEKNVVQPKSVKKPKKKKNIKLKHIDYSYKTPHVGHDNCTYPCTRSAILKCNVPKCMGWFWTADNVHGLKYRPTWRPGAAEKHLIHLLQMARHPKQIVSKKKKKEQTKAKRPLKKPLLVVHKKDGEFTVTMETMKDKPREVYEFPYEDKPVLTYTIGRTDEENKERDKQKHKKQRRLEREQRTYLQSSFKNMCQEICLKSCQQALGILPEAEDKQGLCYANATWVEPENPNLSCACSESSLSVSDTDSDEWILEFTPPNAFFDPSRKVKKIVKTEKDTQYITPHS